MLAFIITAALALLLSSYIILSEIRSSSKAHTICRKILGGLSDQQIVEGIAIQSVGLAKVDSMVPYHFFIIWMLSLLSTATNFATLLALVQDYKRDWVLRWLRQGAMFVNLCLTIAYGVLILEVNSQNLPGTLPVGCVWHDNHAKEAENDGGNSVLSIAGTIAIIAASVLIFAMATWYLHLRRQIWGRTVRVVSMAILFAIAIAATIRVVVISQAFGQPSVQLSDTGERDWSFGELLAMALLILPLISALEILRGEIHVPQSKCDVEVEQIPLTGESKPQDRYSYQQNPWFNR